MSHHSVQIEGRVLTLSNLNKLYWPEDGLTKGDLLSYYLQVGSFLLPHLRDRPLSMRRYPEGSRDEGFFQKQAPEHTPDWVKRVPLTTSDRKIDSVLCQDLPTLIWLANLGCIDQNPWHSRVPHVETPDYVLFDLDPFEPAGLREAIRVALLLKEVLDGLGLESYPKLSGATGFHVYVPIAPRYSFAIAREFAGVIGRKLLAEHPRLITMEWAIAKRGGKVFFDHQMNTQGKTVASVYSPRPMPGAPVSVPLRWDEVHPDLKARDFSIRTLGGRLRQVGDLFEPVLRRKQLLEPAISRLARG